MSIPESLFDAFESNSMYPHYFRWNIYKGDNKIHTKKFLYEGELFALNEATGLFESKYYILTDRSLLMIPTDHNIIFELELRNPRIRKVNLQNL